MKLDFVKLFS